MSTIAPKTPEQPARKLAIHRSFSAARASTTDRAQPTAEIGATEGVETLFTHASGKIVKFTSNAPTRPSSSGTWSPGGSQQQGTLPWATLTEKTMAAGPLEIYRVPGSVSFLHSGSLLHAIMPRSNCWCVDGVSKFAIRVLPDTYYRIELPGNTPEDLVKVEEFKITLQKVLFYERTACPFARTFQVDLPVEGEPKPRKRRRRTDGPAKKWTQDRAYSWKPEGWMPEQYGPSDGSSGSATASDEDSSGSPEESSEELVDQLGEMKVNTPPPSKTPTVRDRARGINMRSVTAPSQLQLPSTPSSKLRTSFYPEDSAHVEGEPQSPSKEAKRPDASAGATREEFSSENEPPNKATKAAREMEPVLGASREEHILTKIIPNRADSDVETSSVSILSHAAADMDNARGRRSLKAMLPDMPPSPPDSNIEIGFASATDASSHFGSTLEDKSSEHVAGSSTVSNAAVNTPVIPAKSSRAVQGPAAVESPAASSDQLAPRRTEHDTHETDADTIPSEPQGGVEDVKDDVRFVTGHAPNDQSLGDNQVPQQATAQSNQGASFPEIYSHSDMFLPNFKEQGTEPSIESGSPSEVDGITEVYIEHPTEEVEPPATPTEPPHSHTVPPLDTTSDPYLTRVTSSEAAADPFAAIQARIQARRSIGGTTTQGLVPTQRQTTLLSSTSSASSGSLRYQRRSQVVSEKDQSVVATALVRKAASAFLGPPVHLVAIMLKIAARFAKGAFPKALLFESPAGMVKRVPGSFDLDDSDIEQEFGSEDEPEEEEDDFGIPLTSPISRLVSGESMPRPVVDSLLKERQAYDAEH